MNRATRSETLQMRVTPGVKRAAEEVLHRLGLTMTEAIELFLHRLIVDRRLTFDVVALDEATFAMIERETAFATAGGSSESCCRQSTARG
jgi:addiction module RelB/DinJ family antitoxin